MGRSNQVYEMFSIGRSLARLTLEKDGKFYNTEDKERKEPVSVKPIDGLSILHVFQYRSEYGPDKDEEINYNLAEKLGFNPNWLEYKPDDKKDLRERLTRGEFGVRLGSGSEFIPYEIFEIIKNPISSNTAQGLEKAVSSI